MGELIHKLRKNGQSDMYPFHMPGHKRNVELEVNPYKMDITEIDGFDDLHNAQGMIGELERRIGKIYGAGKVFLMLNGSTGGILTAISACVGCNDTILMARNSHKSAYNGVFLAKAKTEYIYPQTDESTGISLAINSTQVEKAFEENKKIKAVFITSPTYEGNIADIGAIAQIVHSHDAVLIVDCAHGAHLGIDEVFQANPVKLGADIVIMSTHKTLPAMTQTAIMCVNGNRVDYDKIKKYFDIFLTSSPSYLLMASIEKCYDIVENTTHEKYVHYNNLVDKFRKKCKNLKKLYLYEGGEIYDFGKIVICTDRSDVDGNVLADMLRDKYHIETEMSSKNYVIAMTSFMDREEGFDRLYMGLCDIDGTLGHGCDKINGLELLCRKYEPWEIDECKIKTVNVDEAVGNVSAEYVYVYPPGIPWIVPGEVITENFAGKIQAYENAGIQVRGINNQKIKVIVME